AAVRAVADGELGRHHDVVRVGRAQAGEEGAVGDVEVLGQGVVAPAAGALQGGLAPDPGGAVEVEPEAAGAARGLLDGEVPVDGQRLQAGEQRRVAVD